MCKSNLQIKFCSCEFSSTKEPFKHDPEVEKLAYNKKDFIWTLRKFLGEKDLGMLGQMIMPVEGLNEDLTADNLLWQLNYKNLFDFDYSPAEGDHLEVRQDYFYTGIKNYPRPDLYEYLSFIYRKGTWIEDVYNVFSDKTKRFKKGVFEMKVNL